MTHAVKKASTGISGLDDMTGGGIPGGRTTLVIGGAGSGKTIFGLQTLLAGAKARESGIFVAFEEEAAVLQSNTNGFSWDLKKAKQHLSFFDARLPSNTPVTGEFDLQGLLSALSAQVAKTRSKRIVFDSIDVLLRLLGSQELAIRELGRLQEWLTQLGLTAIITAKVDPQTQGIREPLGTMEFMVDCAIALRHEVLDGVAHRSIRVLKYRGSAFYENLTPMVISASGLEVASPLSPGLAGKLVFSERVSTGVPPLDAMLEGGYYRGSSILVTGAPGSAKSTLSGAFAEAACTRGEPTLFVSFDSDPLEIIRNLESVGIRLGRFRKSGLLKMHSSRGNVCSAEVQLLSITRLARDNEVRCLVVDPVSALAKAGSDYAGFSVVERLIDWAKHRGITVLCTSLLSSSGADVESTPMQISTIADAWLHLSYVVNAGERNRALTIVKSRGTAHSNQVRELMLSNRGVSLAEVYTAEGQVLMGTMRWQKERAEEAGREKQRLEMERRERVARAEQQELAIRLAALQRDLQVKDAELALLREAQMGQAVAEEGRRGEMYLRRAGAKGDSKTQRRGARRTAT